jgi:hypothetical protein
VTGPDTDSAFASGRGHTGLDDAHGGDPTFVSSTPRMLSTIISVPHRTECVACKHSLNHLRDRFRAVGIGAECRLIAGLVDKTGPEANEKCERLPHGPGANPLLSPRRMKRSSRPSLRTMRTASCCSRGTGGSSKRRRPLKRLRALRMRPDEARDPAPVPPISYAMLAAITFATLLQLTSSADDA